jgi:hypothetical protein
MPGMSEEEYQEIREGVIRRRLEARIAEIMSEPGAMMT